MNEKLERKPLPETPGDPRRRYMAVPDHDITGKLYHLVMDRIGEYVVHFLTDDNLIFAKKGEVFRSFSYKCFHCDEAVWHVGFLMDERFISLVLDEAQRLVTMVIGAVEPARPELVYHDIQFGAIQMFNEELPFKRHGFTDDLVGKKIIWHYSPYVNLTHCYVSEHYMRNSLHNMQPVPEDASPEAKFDAENRIERWGKLFFEEPAQYIRINPHLYLVTIIEAQRNRIDPLQGGGDMILAINTDIMQDFGFGYHNGLGTPNFGLISVYGDFDDTSISFEKEYSPYHV